MNHDLRLQYTHRHKYKYLRRTLWGDYLFICDECDRHGLPAWKAVSSKWFWEGR